MNSVSNSFRSGGYISQRLYQAVLIGFLLITILMGCARIPKESVLLSEELTGMIRSARSAHLELLNMYMAERRARADNFMAQKWTPDFMNRYISESTALSDLDTAKTISVKRQIMLDFSQAASDEILNRRATITEALNEIECTLRDAFETHYADMIMVNQALTDNLRSAAKATATREELFQKLKNKPEEIVNLDELNPLLERIISFTAKTESISALVDSAKTLIKGEK